MLTLDELFYEKTSGKLFYGEELLAQFKTTTGEDIRRILSCFDEEEWPEFIYDPTPPRGREITPRGFVGSALYQWNSRQHGNEIQLRLSASERGTKIHAELFSPASDAGMQSRP